jgi:putative membrane protein
MQKLILRWIINAVALWVAITFVPGIHQQGGWPALLALAVIFGLINALLRPLIEILTCPLIILTLGLGTLLINTLLFWLSGLIGQQFGVGFTVDNFWAAFFGALVVTLVSTILTLLLKDELSSQWKARRRS